ncbi:phosphatidylserine decarboxylase [Fulvivirga sp. 29W222]|uniref:Phosphatidylserine decarboxylase n=1 Tax=Fulvivirga marina TaxID=2494733 RepID=A0A937FZ93_9BACT|nr:phosphatidylserine decarboxylase [Fulvivirga marina]MBL6448870.1 phosphatidylserine decarboxylase [Fulvivirga marina]
MTTLLYRFISLNIWGLLPAYWQKQVSKIYSKVYNKTFTRYIIQPYCKFNGLGDDYLGLFQSENGRKGYRNFQDFFTRKYIEPPKINSPYIWPCEGLLCDIGLVSSMPKINVKGDKRHIRAIFGSYGSKIPDDYYFSNIFLHNNNYHRIHAPVSGTAVDYERIPGELILLRPWVYKTDPSLPAIRNERVNVILRDDDGLFWYLSIVGGPAVGTIVLNKNFKPGTYLSIGDEIGMFLLGSTCCMATPIESTVIKGSKVQMGSTY